MFVESRCECVLCFRNWNDIPCIGKNGHSMFWLDALSDFLMIVYS